MCSALYHSSAQSSSCTAGIAFYLIIVGAVVGVILAGVVVWRLRVRRRNELRQHDRQLEIDRLIPKPLEGPVYRGL